MRKLYCGILILLLVACQEKYDPNIEVTEGYLVVEGVITNRKIPQEIKLTRTKLFNESHYYYPVFNAQIEVIDDLGNSYIFEEENNGTYSSGLDFLGGKEGRTYYVRIQTADGEIYESEPEKLNASEDVSTIYCDNDIQSVRVKDYYGNVEEKLYDGMQIKCDLDYAGQNYYMFRWRGKYQYRSYIVNRSGNFEEMYCRKFIHNKYLKEISVFDLSELKNGVSKDNELTFITWDDINEYEPELVYSILSIEDVIFEGIILEVEQHCISEKALRFWNTVKTQSLAENRLFDPISYQVEGNIRCVTNPSKKIFGYLGCSGVVKKLKYLYATRSGNHYAGDALVYPVDEDPEYNCYLSMPDDYITAPF